MLTCLHSSQLWFRWEIKLSQVGNRSHRRKGPLDSNPDETVTLFSMGFSISASIKLEASCDFSQYFSGVFKPFLKTEIFYSEIFKLIMGILHG